MLFFHIFVMIYIIGIRNLFLIRPTAEKGRSFSAVLCLYIYEESIRISILRLTLVFLFSYKIDTRLNEKDESLPVFFYFFIRTSILPSFSSNRTGVIFSNSFNTVVRFTLSVVIVYVYRKAAESFTSKDIS